jgi:MoaA/NifB/PqqE/SkfB family radical SAM enzyme
MQTLQQILDELGDALILVSLYGWGEPFLNRELPQMIEACTTRNILTLSSTNGQCIQTVEEALKVVDAGLTALTIALDGSTQEIYQSYRKGGDFEKVKRCVVNVEEAKARRGSHLPYTNLRVVATQYNQEDLPNVEKLAQELGVNMFSYKSLGTLVNSEKFGNYEPSADGMRRFEYEGSNRRRKPLIQCPYPFRQPTVFWDGTVVGCEYDYDLEGPWGKVGKESFVEVWRSQKALKLRKSIYTGRNRPRFCNLCPYKDRVQDSCVLLFKEIHPLAL